MVTNSCARGRASNQCPLSAQPEITTVRLWEAGGLVYVRKRHMARCGNQPAHDDWRRTAGSAFQGFQFQSSLVPVDPATFV